MTNPLKNEDQIYKRIEDENLKVHPVIWELINHHVRNELTKINIALWGLYLIPKWILKIASFLIKSLYKVSFQPGNPPHDLETICSTGLKGVKDAGAFLKKLRQATYKE